MNERTALASLPRHEDTIAREIDEQYRIVEMLRKLAGEFWNCDTRPQLFDAETMHLIGRIGPEPIPPLLTEELTRETTRLAELEHELHLAHSMRTASI